MNLASDKEPAGSLDEMGVRQGGLSGFLNYWLRSWRVTFLVLIGLAIFGTWTAVTLPRESTPEVEIPVAVVVTAYPGASARDVEELVTKPIEERLTNLEGLDNLTSSSRLGISSVVVEFSANEDLKDAIRRLKEEVDSIRGLPEAAERSEVMEISISDEPIISVSLGGIEDERLLSLYADNLAKKIEEIPDVSSVDIAGSINEEVRIRIEPKRLADLGLSIGQLMSAVRTANINAPFGQLETDKYNYDLRLTGRFNGIGDVAQIPVALPDGTVAPLGTIAEVDLVLTERESQSRMSRGGEESTPAVSLSVRKKTGGNIVRIVDEVKQKIEEEKGELHSDIQVELFADRAEDIRTQLNNVYSSGVQTLLIVFGLLWLFLGWGPGLITALSVPLTFAISFLVFAQTNTTLNGISLFSLILSMGMLVDNAIVVVEGICGHQDEIATKSSEGLVLRDRDSKELKEKKIQARSAEMVDKFTKPLIGGTMTTVAAFFPMLLVTGIIGQFLKVIPIVLSATLISSLFVSLAFLPPVAVKVLGRRSEDEGQERWFDRQFDKFRNWYANIIGRILEAKRFQALFITVLAVLLVFGLSLPFSGLLHTGLFPAVDIDFMFINIEREPGTKLEETLATVERVENIIRGVPEVRSYVANIGSGISLDFGSGSSGEEVASLYVNLEDERERSSLDITNELRENFKQITDAQVTVEELTAGPPSAPPVEMRIIGDDMNELDRLSGLVMEEMDQVDGVIDIDRDLTNSAGEFNFSLDQEALTAMGLGVSDVAQTLRASVFGTEVTTFLDQSNEEVRVSMAAFDQAVNSIDDVLAMPILSMARQSTMGEATAVTLGQVAKVDLASSVDAIRHRDGKRTVTITADADKGFTPNELTLEITKKVEAMGLPDGYSVEFGGEQQETVETFNQLYRSMVIAILLILLILVIEFNSFRQTFIIFLSIPLALIGVLFGLLFFQGQLNFAAFIGLVSLTGIVVNNAILLVDRMNSMREKGATIIEAVNLAANSRLRPILLTTLTTVGGIVPLIWVDEFFRDMAVTLVTGLSFSTLLTLVLIPILYYRQQSRLERKKNQASNAVEHGKGNAVQLSPVP
ncbi:MAG TPA: hypothetical protein DDW41_05140 [Candidatus Andersenbacteria bacterium]|nr:hypothetical protein [Candidatus Andersenbacteria bacterium]